MYLRDTIKVNRNKYILLCISRWQL